MTKPAPTTHDGPAADAGGFGIFARPGFALGLACALGAALALFAAMPEIDRAVSGWFHDAACAPATGCATFPAALDPVLATFRQFGHGLPLVVVAAALAFNPLRGLIKRTIVPHVSRMAAALALAMALGPGLIVNGILKAHAGRPRPRDTDLFGGLWPFTPAGDFSGACPANCSFVSGEAAGAGLLVCAIVLLPARWRPAGLLVLAPLTLAIALLRVAFGGHYLSDVVLGYGLSVLVFCLVALVFERRGLLRPA